MKDETIDIDTNKDINTQSMIQVDLYNWEKNKVGKVDLSPNIFKQEVREDLVSELIRWQRAKKRQGSHNTKDRGDVRGGGAKPFKQKGTGNARQGSIRSPLLRKGGVAHGPHPRDYSYNLPIKVRRKAFKSVLSLIYGQGGIYVVEDMTSKEGKSKELFQRLKKFGLKKALLVDGKKNLLFQRACRNIPYYQHIEVRGLNGFDLLKYQNVVFTKKGIEEVHKKYEESS